MRARWLALAGVAVVVVAVLSIHPSPGAPQDRPLAALTALAPGQPLRLTVMGTSLTADYNWPERLAAALATCLGREVDLARVARAGFGSAWGRGQAADVLAGNPDILLMEFAINDADMLDGVSLAVGAAAHRALIGEVRAARPDLRIALMTMSPAQGLRGLLRPRLGAHYAQYRLLADSLGLGLVDLYPRWMARPRKTRGLAADGLHPTTDTASDVILPVLLPYLGRAAGADCAAPE